MSVICPVTNKECPYLKKLDTDVCPRERYCDAVRESYSGMIQKPPAPRKFLIILFSIILAAIIGLSIVYFLVLDGDLAFLSPNKNNGNPAAATTPTQSATQTPEPTPAETAVLPSNTPLPVTTPVPSTLAPVPVTSDAATMPVRIEIFGQLGEIQKVGLDEHQGIDVIQSARIVSWYEGSYVPGTDGNCILFGYKHYDGMEGIFFNLAKLQPGDKIKITLDNGTVLEQTVTESIIYRDGFLPEEALAIENPTPRTVIISETGEIDPQSGNFKDLIAIIAE